MPQNLCAATRRRSTHLVAVSPILQALLVVTTLACTSSDAPTGAQASLAIRNVVLLDPSTAETSQPSTVLIDGDRILAVAAEGSLESSDALTMYLGQ